MSASVRLVNPTEDRLNAAFAEHVAGWTDLKADTGYCSSGRRPDGHRDNVPEFCQSVDAILPYLEAWRAKDPIYHSFIITRYGYDYIVELRGHMAGPTVCHDISLPRAIVICLLRAVGVEITFT